jgi:hypothetical protein
MLSHTMSLLLNASLPIQVEKLIKELPTAPSDSSNAEVPNNDTGMPNGEAGTGVRETQSILLERIASEMNRLKFYISHAQVCVSVYCCSNLKVLFFWSLLKFLRKIHEENVLSA